MFIFTHGDGDGVCAGAIALAAHPGTHVFFTHPAGFLEDLKDVEDDLIVCDIALDSRHAPKIMEKLENLAAAGHKILYFDHHPLPIDPDNFPGRLIHDLDRSATELVFQFFDGTGLADFLIERLAIIGAIADYFDQTPLIQALLQKWEKRSIFLETGIIVQGLYAYRWNYEAKRTLVTNLSKGQVPSGMATLVASAIEQTKEEERAMKRISAEYRTRGAIAWIYDPGASKSKAAHWVMGFANTPIGIAIEFRKDFADLTIRGRGLVNLTDFIPEIAERLDGYGGGHPNACGLRVPKEDIKAALKLINLEVEKRTR